MLATLDLTPVFKSRLGKTLVQLLDLVLHVAIVLVLVIALLETEPRLDCSSWSCLRLGQGYVRIWPFKLAKLFDEC